MRKSFLSLLAICSMQFASRGQSIEPNLQDSTKWGMVNRKAEPINENGKKGIRINEMPGDGLMILKGSDFSNGTIELDIKGSNKLQQSFVGFAFHGQDMKTFDAIYFRPFNFKSDDPTRRSHAVQYISMPNYDWEKLRNEFPGKYENKIEPAPGPDDWFHVQIKVNGMHISVFVNNNDKSVLEVDKLNTNNKGGYGLWVGNNSGGSFANVKITKANVSANANNTATIPYGNNPAAGHYFNAGDAKLYYEIYGQGKPLVLLHGGVYGYIDEFEPFIQKFAQDFQVICIATRGHGKSEIGYAPFTYQQRAEDAYKVIRSITKDSVIVLGFSDGAFSGLKLAALYPELVKRLIAIGAGDKPNNNTAKKYNYTPEILMKYDSAFFAGRVKLMPEPNRWRECLSMLNKLYNEDFMSGETFEKIQCPVLVMRGDRDADGSVESSLNCTKAIRNAQLSVIPGCNHVVFYCNFPAVWEAIHLFVYN